MALIKTVVVNASRQTDEGFEVTWTFFKNGNQVSTRKVALNPGINKTTRYVFDLGDLVNATSVKIDVFDLEGAGPVNVELLGANGEKIAAIGPFPSAGNNVTQSQTVNLPEISHQTPWWVWGVGAAAVIGILLMVTKAGRR